MLICALQIKAIAESRKKTHGKIAISVPVDLRKVFFDFVQKHIDVLSCCRESGNG